MAADAVAIEVRGPARLPTTRSNRALLTDDSSEVIWFRDCCRLRLQILPSFLVCEVEWTQYPLNPHRVLSFFGPPANFAGKLVVAGKLVLAGKLVVEVLVNGLMIVE